MYTLRQITQKIIGRKLKFFIAKDENDEMTDWVIALAWEDEDKYKFAIRIDLAASVKENPNLNTLNYRSKTKISEKGENYKEIFVFIELFYMVIINRNHNEESESGDYHLEKLFLREDAVKIIDEEIYDYTLIGDVIILTNDTTLLSKYIIALNIDELKMLCNIKSLNIQNIRISDRIFKSFSEEIFIWYTKIHEGEFISASMVREQNTIYPYKDETTRVCQENCSGWIGNNAFLYFKTPNRYKNTGQYSEIFDIVKLERANLEYLNSHFNVKLQDVGLDENKDLNWEFINGQLRYFDKVSSERLYISPENISLLNPETNPIFAIKTKLDRSFYIEHYVLGLYQGTLHNQLAEQRIFENFKKKILWVDDEHRTNPWSLRPGGSTVVVEYLDNKILGYDKVKRPERYMLKIFKGDPLRIYHNWDENTLFKYLSDYVKSIRAAHSNSNVLDVLYINGDNVDILEKLKEYKTE
jgi:hypothetical protein